MTTPNQDTAPSREEEKWDGPAWLTKAQRRVVIRLRDGVPLFWAHDDACPRWHRGIGRVYYPTILPLLDAGIVTFPEDSRGSQIARRAVLNESALSPSSHAQEKK